MLRAQRNGLLDKSVQHGGNPEHPLAVIGIWNLHATHRLRWIPSGQNVGFDVGPVVHQVLGQLIDAHAVDARRAFVPAHLSQGSSQVVAFENAGQQLPMHRPGTRACTDAGFSRVGRSPRVHQARAQHSQRSGLRPGAPGLLCPRLTSPRCSAPVARRRARSLKRTQH